MNRFLLFLALLSAGQAVHSQYVYTIKADSVKITNSCDTAELIIENHTQTVPGFLFNKGKGRTEFRRGAIKLNQFSYLIGADTLNMPQVNANNGASIANGNIVLGNDLGSTTAQLMNTREIPLNGNNMLFTGLGKIGIGTNNPRGILELVTPLYNTADLIFSTSNEPSNYFHIIENSMWGDITGHKMNFKIKYLNNLYNALELRADSTLFLYGHTRCEGDIGVTIGKDKTPRAKLDMVDYGSGKNTDMIVMGYLDYTHYHTIKTSFHGADASQNAIQFYVSKSQYAPFNDFGQANPLNLLGNNEAQFNGKISVQQTAPTALIHVGPGSSAIHTAPIKLTAGTVLAMPEDGAIEYDGNELYFTSNAVRYKLGKILEGQLTTNFGVNSLGAFTHALATVTVAGAQPGDVVNVSANSGTVNPTSIIITGYVTSANLVTLQAYNASNSTVTITSDTYKVRVIK